MAVVPTGILSLPLFNLATLLSKCPNFRAWTGTGNEAAAFARIEYQAVDDFNEDTGASTITHPFAMIQFSSQENWALNTAGQGAPSESGELILYFEDLVASENQDSQADAFFTFSNALGAIITDVFNLAVPNGLCVPLQSITSFDGPYRDPKTRAATSAEMNNWAFKVSWGALS